MKKRSTYLVLACLSLGFVTALNPQSKKITKTFFPDFNVVINTPAFQKKKGFTSYAEMMAFLQAAQSKHPDVMSISFIGESQKGVKIPLVKLKTAGEKRLKVWLQGGLHGDEPASTEGVLFLIDQLLNNVKYSYLLDKLEIAIVPMANIDGYEKQDRYSANGLDLNRDQTKLLAPETVVLKRAYNQFSPQVAVDFHEYRPYRKDFAQMSEFGITSRYDVMFMHSGNLNVPENLRAFTKDIFVKNAENQMDSAGLVHHEYLTTVDILGETQFSQGSDNARSSATNNALTNVVSSLIEVRGVGIDRTSFNRRVYTTFLVGASYLRTAYEQVDRVKNELEMANKAEQDVVVESKKDVSVQPLKVIDLASNKEIELQVKVRNAMKSKAVLSRARPTAYLLDESANELVEKLEILGIVVDRLESTKNIDIERYTITDYLQEANKYEGANMQEVKVEIQPENRAFAAGSYVVYLNQPHGNLAIELLEPEAPNSFVSFNVLNTSAGKDLPIYRYLKKEKL